MFCLCGLKIVRGESNFRMIILGNQSEVGKDGLLMKLHGGLVTLPAG